MIVFAIAAIAIMWTAVIGIVMAHLGEKRLQKENVKEEQASLNVLSDDAPVTSNVSSFRVYEGSNIYESLGSPTKVGQLVETNMESGKAAIFVLAKIAPERMGYVTINWLEFKFVKYVEQNE
jgi:hypothetical protein